VVNGFQVAAFTLQPLDDGRTVTLGPVTAARRLAEGVVSVGPWKHYGRTAETFARRLVAPPRYERVWEVQLGGVPLGAVIVQPQWLAGPFLGVVAVLPSAQGLGVGTRILDWYAATARLLNERQAWLCVSAFNVDAQRFYLRHGYEHVTLIHNLVRDGDDEWLMRKRLT
jgi:ribosomal protein S18 acetylase RimI-like enzyme